MIAASRVFTSGVIIIIEDEIAIYSLMIGLEDFFLHPLLY
jgi:hypothetical protein